MKDGEFAYVVRHDIELYINEIPFWRDAGDFYVDENGKYLPNNFVLQFYIRGIGLPRGDRYFLTKIELIICNMRSCS